MACPETLPVRSTMIREALVHNDDITQYTTPTVTTMLMNDERFQFTE